MKRAFPILLALGLVGIIATTATAAVFPVGQYSQLRQSYPQINDAIAAATESDLHGVFNRLSALYNRAPVKDLVAGAGDNGQLPANFLRNLEATLIDLQEDLGKDQLGGLTATQKLDILQVVSLYAARPLLGYYQAQTPRTCPCPLNSNDNWCLPTCVDNDPAVINELQKTVDAARTLYQNVRTAAGNPASTVAHGSLTASNFTANVEELARVLGVEHIDY